MVERALPLLYDAEMAQYYARYRAVPEMVASIIASAGQIRCDTRVLDVATGTGSLAIALARHSAHVTGIDTSAAMLTQAREAARRAGANVDFLQESAECLLFHTRRYDVVVVCQAFHWFDASLGARGVWRVLDQDGRLFMVESKCALPERHPLRTEWGFGAPLGQPLDGECVRHAREHERVFNVMSGTGDVTLEQVWMCGFEQQYDLGFARAYFPLQRLRHPGTDGRTAPMGERLRKLQPKEAAGRIYWFVASYGRGARRAADTPPASDWMRRLELALG